MKTSLAVAVLFAGAVFALPVHDDRRRAMSSWSGWMPGSGMTLFTSGEDPWGMQPPPIWRMDDDGNARPLEHEQEGSQPHAPPTHSLQPRKRVQHEEDEEEEEDSRRGSSKANASFNAWFPIVLGMYPGEESGGRSRSEGWRDGSERGVAAVANSVNHGKSGVASSHAIVYSGEPPTRRRASNDLGQSSPCLPLPESSSCWLWWQPCLLSWLLLRQCQERKRTAGSRERRTRTGSSAGASTAGRASATGAVTHTHTQARTRAASAAATAGGASGAAPGRAASPRLTATASPLPWDPSPAAGHSPAPKREGSTAEGDSLTSTPSNSTPQR